MSQAAVNNKYENEELSIWNDFEYNQDFDEEYYNEILLESPMHLEGDLYSDHWILSLELLSITFNLKFEEINTIASKYNFPFDLTTVVKCWMVTLIEQNRSSSMMKSNLNNLVTFLNVTEGIQSERIEDLIIAIESGFGKTPKNLPSSDFSLGDDSDKNKKAKLSFCTSILNFFSFFPKASVQEYHRLLYTIRNNSGGYESANRLLPSFNDIKIFSSVLKDYFSNLEVGSADYLKFFLIYIWWELTCIIPLRPSEFCRIQRDALKIERGKYYLQLPRIKQKANINRIQVIDKIMISERLAKKIKEYINVTKEYGNTETLLSYQAYSMHPKNFTANKKINKGRFTSITLKVVLEAFYYFIVQKLYGYTIIEKFSPKTYANAPQCKSDNVGEIFRRIRPGDTRHFAMMNLLRQGYHSLEMARLAGHTSLNAQNPYQQHDDLEYDFKLVKIADYLGRELDTEINFKDKDIKKKDSFPFKDFPFMVKKVDVDPREGYKDKLDVGFCIDELKRCPGKFSEMHIHCRYWRIGQEEFLEKKDEIARALKESKSNIHQILQTLYNLHSIALKEYNKSYDYLEDNVIHRSEIDKLNKNISNELHFYENALQNLKDSGVLNNG